MKTVIATVLALTVSAPAVAQVGDAAAFFALGNDSAAERIVGETSVGDVFQAQTIGAAANDSAAERHVHGEAGIATSNDTILRLFALGNDSAAERIVK